MFSLICKTKRRFYTFLVNVHSALKLGSHCRSDPLDRPVCQKFPTELDKWPEHDFCSSATRSYPIATRALKTPTGPTRLTTRSLLEHTDLNKSPTRSVHEHRDNNSILTRTIPDKLDHYSIPFRQTIIKMIDGIKINKITVHLAHCCVEYVGAPAFVCI